MFDELVIAELVRDDIRDEMTSSVLSVLASSTIISSQSVYVCAITERMDSAIYGAVLKLGMMTETRPDIMPPPYSSYRAFPLKTFYDFLQTTVCKLANFRL